MTHDHFRKFFEERAGTVAFSACVKIIKRECNTAENAGEMVPTARDVITLLLRHGGGLSFTGYSRKLSSLGEVISSGRNKAVPHARERLPMFCEFLDVFAGLPEITQTNQKKAAHT